MLILEHFIRRLGFKTIQIIRNMGHMFIFLAVSFYSIFIPPFKFKLLLKQIRFMGNKSLVVICLIGAFTGMVLALQVYYTLRKFGSEAMLGPAVALSLIRELGPVLAALTVTGRAGSAITAEIGIMRITEQIDALVSMALNPMRYLVVPNIVGAIIVFPLLTAIFDVVGIFGGYIVAVKLLDMSSGTYFSQMKQYITMTDIKVGVYKSICFGIIISWICCYKGYYTKFGAKGVSQSMTEAVVLSSIFVLIWDYFLGAVYL